MLEDCEESSSEDVEEHQEDLEESGKIWMLYQLEIVNVNLCL